MTLLKFVCWSNFNVTQAQRTKYVFIFSCSSLSLMFRWRKWGYMTITNLNRASSLNNLASRFCTMTGNQQKLQLFFRWQQQSSTDNPLRSWHVKMCNSWIKSVKTHPDITLNPTVLLSKIFLYSSSIWKLARNRLRKLSTEIKPQMYAICWHL